MSGLLIKGMKMPEGCYYCPILTGKANCICAITGTKIRIEKVREELEDGRMPDCPLVEHLDSSWHTEMPTEEGWYLIAYHPWGRKENEICYCSFKWKDNRWFDYVYDYDTEPYLIAWKRIEPYKESE